MRKLAGRAAIPALLALVLFGCAQDRPEGVTLATGEKLQITQRGLGRVPGLCEARPLGWAPTGNGAFGVALVGDVGGGRALSTYTLLPARRMTAAARAATNALTSILDVCRRENVECIIFAAQRTIEVPYEIVN